MDNLTTSMPLTMSRSVSQLLFTYLPGKVVDWEDGIAIVQLQHVRLRSAWSGERAQLVLDQVGRYLDTWEQRGGSVHPFFPNPRSEPERFIVGEPESISAAPLPGALVCQRCSQLVFRTPHQIAAAIGKGLECPGCGARSLRQFGQIFVHGCGHFETLSEFLPWMSRGDGQHKYRVSQRPIRCSGCGKNDRLIMPARSDRARDMAIVCRRCDGLTVIDRLVARCPECTKQLARAPASEDADDEQQATAVSRVAMRITNSRATDAYYAHALNILRLDRPYILTTEDDEIRLLTRLLPEDQQPQWDGSQQVASLQELVRRLGLALSEGNSSEVERLQEAIVAAASASATSATVTQLRKGDEQAPSIADDIKHSLGESLAFRTTVTMRSVPEILFATAEASALLSESIRDLTASLGLNRVLMVDDLPVISASFGFTRRTFEPTYDEDALNAKGLPTQIRPFYALDHAAARRIDRLDAVGAVPVIAREGEHEGMFISLDPVHVLSWLKTNRVRLLGSSTDPISHILPNLEPVDRYYDTINELPIRRMVFGLVHSLSHAAMRAISRLAGLERTSLSEYIFLPLLGTVIYANGSTTKLGAIETVVRSRMLEFLEVLSQEALDCLYDPVCIDHRGACHGCLHSPEISCRVFNHGLSRAYLTGGHSPWLDASVENDIVGYWDPRART